MALNFRETLLRIVPSWLSADDGGKVLFVLGVLIDASVERLRQGLDARFPSRTGPSALVLIGQDRGIQRGRSETDAHYAARLKAWRYPRGHRVRGSAFALLEQISEYWGAVADWVIDANGTRHDRTAAGVESYSYGNSWTWDSLTGLARFWVCVDGSDLFTEHPDFGDANLFGGSLGTDGAYVWGMAGWTYDDTRAMRRLMTGRAWRPAGTQPEWLVVSLDGTDPTPDATWEHWSENTAGAAGFRDNVGTQVAARDVDFRYVSLAPAYNNTYTGDPDNFPATVTLCDASTDTGDGAAWVTSTTLPDSSSYAGDDSWVTSVQLIDDGEGA